jgi:hypothetical protein
MVNFWRGYFSCLIDPAMMPMAIAVAVVIGSLLFAINHGTAFLSGQMEGDRWLSAGLTYLVPYAVNIHGQYVSRRRKC